MPQKIVQTQSLEQTTVLSPQQVLQVRLLEMPVSELEQRVKNELMENGALEESLDTGASDEMHGGEVDDAASDDSHETDDAVSDFLSDDYRSAEVRQALDDYGSPDDVPDYLLRDDGRADRPERMEYGDTTSFYEQMTAQMHELSLTPREEQLMTYLIGSLESDGLLHKKLSALADELEIYNGVQTSEQELEEVLHRLQEFDPPGVGARDLRECLLLQLRRDPRRDTPLKQQEYAIIDRMFDDFTHNRWDRICRKMHLTEAGAARLQKDLRRLNPRPGCAMGEVVGHNFQQIVPDFSVRADEEGQLVVTMNRGGVPQLRVSPSFLELLHEAQSERSHLGRTGRQALQYTRLKIEKAQGFIEAVRQRQHTLMSVMQAIADLQRPFFLEGDESLLRPMILKDVAVRTGLDISTVSRAAGSKYVETDYGTFPLKWFFSDSYVTEEGEEIAVRRIQAALRECVEAEDKRHPLSDGELTAMLNGKGFPIARRTVAKYREQLGIPVARLRR